LLAEEIGLSIGDGYVSNKRFEYRLKGNKKDEKEYYKNYVKPMFKELYNINLNISEYGSTVGFEIYSKALWEFKTKVIGLPIAPKKTIRIPAVLKVNDKEILCSLLRGLFDTDGNIYFRSQGANKSYYPRVSFTTISKDLADDLIEILKMLGFKPKLYLDSKIKKKNSNLRYTVVLCGYANFELYKKLINTKQPKNIYKLKTWEERFGK
jgi:intein/homing endonuclease